MEKTTLLDAYLSGPWILRAAVTGISREQLVSRPVAGRWSVLEVVCTWPTPMPISPIGSSVSCRRSDQYSIE